MSQPFKIVEVEDGESKEMERERSFNSCVSSDCVESLFNEWCSESLAWSGGDEIEMSLRR